MVCPRVRGDTARGLSPRTGGKIKVELFYNTVISVGLAQYEIFRTDFCDFCQRSYS